MATSIIGKFEELCKLATVTYADTDNTDLFDLPPNSYVLGVLVDVVTAFSGGESQLLDIGIKNLAGTDEDYFANDIDVSAANRASVTALKHGIKLDDRPVTITAKVASGDTAGEANIAICYVNLGIRHH